MNLKKNLTLLLSYFLTLLRERRLALFVCFCFALLKTNAQIDKTAILEKLKLEFFPQNQDVNPFQHPREKYIIQCLETQIKNNLSLAVRCDAIVCLAWSLQPDYLPLTLEYGKREALSVPEKLALAGAYTIYGVYTPQHYLREEAVKLLNDVCYYTPSNDKLQHTCIWTYYKLGGDAAKNYYISLLEQKELTERVSVAAYGLAPLGECDIIFPIFVEAIRSNLPQIILCAIDGLRVMGTTEALRLIEEQTRSKDEKVIEYAKETLKKINNKGGKL